MASKLTYYLRRLYQELSLRILLPLRLRQIEAKDPVLVYQMGKVGSSTVCRWLSMVLSRPILQIHILNERNLREAIRVTRHSAEIFLPEHLLTSLALVKKLRRERFPCKIVTLTRDPIERAISFVFEDRVRKLPELYKHSGENAVIYAAEKLRSILSSDDAHADPTKWFRGELETVFGIDVFRTPYDFEGGFRIIEHHHHPVLVIRMEDLNRSFGNAFRSFLGINRDVLSCCPPANVGATKQYGHLLRQVKSTLKLPADIVTRIYSTQYARHFYDPDIPKLIERWSALTIRGDFNE